ncbi:MULTISPECIES: hypothetical protein [unclassified Actinotalea]|uniref:hypothetical protein n=1 Tax=unclassified Actinotalea TaxID=2638618 RepID=UPI0015F429B4|nr:MULTISPECIES: hypothetical protein [unclassified Actinotalea]
MRATTVVAALALTSALLVACTPAPGPQGGTPAPTPTPEAVHSPAVRLPGEPVTVLDSTDAATRAAGTSAAFFAEAAVAVVVPAGDVAGQLEASAAAVSLGVPLLLTDGSTVPDATAAELERLGVEAVLIAGGLGRDDVRDGGLDVPVIVEAATDPARADDVLRVPALPVPAPAPGGEVAAVAALDPASVATQAPTDEDTDGGTDEGTEDERTDEQDDQAASGPSSATSSAGGGEAASEEVVQRLPLTERADAPPGGLLLTTGDAGDLAAVATARAAGVPVVVVPGGDPRATSAAVQGVAAAQPTSTVALGAAFGTAPDLGWRVATAATGVELPGGGQVLFPGRRLVAMYGTPHFAALGILGEQDVPASIARAQGLAASYQPLTADVVVPAFEIIVTVASAGAGPDGNYSNELPVESFVPWVEAARDAGVYVVIDLQPGRTDFLTQAQQYEPLLRYPNVGLALDPEWRLAPDQVHLRQIGSVHADEVNATGAWLAELTRTHALPQKLFVLHQFSHRMIQARETVATSYPELSVMIHVDGQGSQPAKAGTWGSLQQGAPAGLTWGWKNFIDEDVPMLAPDQTYAVQPVPELVTYQ